MRFADARTWLVAAAALGLLACTGPGLEPPGESNDLSGPRGPGPDGAPSVGSGGTTGGGGTQDAGQVPPVVDPPAPSDSEKDADAGAADAAVDAGDADLDAGAD